MSAYIVNSEHIGALAAFAVSHSASLYAQHTNDPQHQAKLIAGGLAQANIDSIIARYGANHGNNVADDMCGSAPAEFIADCITWAEHYYFQPPAIGSDTNLSIYRMARCLDYQACEVRDWAGSTAERQIRSIQDAAVRSMKGFYTAARDYYTRAPIPGPADAPVLISTLFAGA
jgi:hypothetical protein